MSHSTAGTELSPITPKMTRGWLRLRIVIGCALAGGCSLLALWSRSASQSPAPDAVASLVGWADEQRCADCHAEICDTFADTGHARTLRPINDPQSIELLGSLPPTPDHASEVTVQREGGSVRAVCSRGDSRQSIPLEWCFGSGRHARTWVGVLPGSWGETEMVEFRWTWYSAINGFAVTPGQAEQPANGYFAGLGTLYDQPKALRCFACHASHLPVVDGRIDFVRLVPGIGCQRCHGPLAEHVERQDAGIDHRPGPTWSTTTRLDSVNRCGQCHRRADEQPPGDIRADNIELVRFQPVGLVQSACFTKSESMTCHTCHDPHRSLEATDSKGIWQCLQCHNPREHATHVGCSARHTTDCLTCHMPAVRFPAPLLFTDHWIRVRTEKAE